MLEEQKGGFACFDREVLLHLGPFLASKRGIGQDDIVAVFFLNVRQVFGQRVGMNDIWRFNAVQDHVHDADDVGQRLLFLSVEGALLQGLRVFGGQALAGPEIFKGLTQKARRTGRAVIHPVADSGSNHLHNSFNKRPRGVVFAAVSACVPHVLDFVFIQVRHLMLLSMGAEAEFVYPVDDLPQVVAALYLVFKLAENLTDFVFDGCGALG